ncbi:MAG TPA: phospholipid carrier-dependent glycosyltransferase [Croceibacterium sp.]|nr:phospholipid carrier-dependent glycosyltransferase [Croceibacterium sp.]
MNPPSVHAPHHSADPIGWIAAITAAFAALIWVRLTIPTQPFFDEIHYLPAARTLLELSHPLNREHPPMGKELIAAGMLLAGDNTLGWRIMSALFGVLTLFAAMRAMWFASQSRFATLATGVLIATGFGLFVQSRIAMLDIFMLSFAMVGIWMCAGAVRHNRSARWRLPIAGVALGFAVACKWNAAPIAMLPGLAFLVVRAHAARWRLLTSSKGAPVEGMSLIEAGLWLGLLPLVAYCAAYWPFLLYEKGSIEPTGLLALHVKMLELQEQVIKPHTYMSTWWQWVLNWRPIWYYYEVGDGAQRGVLMIGNPLTMLAGLPAVAWCLYAGVRRGRTDALAVALLYLAALGMWIIAPKPVQFYYHYLLPSCFLLAALALALDAMWRRGWRWQALGVIAGSVAMFAVFYPILSAAPLAGRGSYEFWMWLRSWR